MALAVNREWQVEPEAVDDETQARFDELTEQRLEELRSQQDLTGRVNAALASAVGLDAEIAPDPTAVLGSIAFVRRVHSASTILINHETSVLGYQIAALDNHQDATVLVMPSRRETSIGGGSLRISIARLRSPDGAARTSRSTSTRCFSLSSRARILSRRGFGCFGPQKIPAGTEE
jgi:hypothetical protein